jgi:hypothetical protein
MQTISQSTPKARKAHRCMWCYRTIDPGETYSRAFNTDGVTGWTWINCLHCEAFVTLAGIEDWDGDGISVEHILEHEPTAVSDLRLKALHRKKWRRADGTLYPVPTP